MERSDPEGAGRSALEVEDPAEARDFWDRSVAGWHAVWLGVLAVVGAVLALTAAEDPDRLVGLGAVAVLVAAYLLVGGRLVVAPARDVVGLPYLLLVLAGLVVIQRVADQQLVTPALFALFPQLWVLLSRRGAVVGTVLVPLVLGAARAAELGWAPAAVRDVLVESTAQFAVALLLGLWVTGLVQESASRAEMVEQLRAAREELAAAERARGVLAERERMAREIHDTLAQGFTSTVALAQAARAALEQLPSGAATTPATAQHVDTASLQGVAAARDHLALMETTARSNLAEARAIVEALRPVDLSVGDGPGGAAGQDGADPPLLGALHRLGRRFSAETGTRSDVTGAADLPPLPLRVEVVLLRAAQEGLNNVRRHARAGHVQVGVDVDDDEIVLRVVDDGRGPGRSTGGGYGLEAMASRLREVGGHAVLEPGAAGGSALSVRVPLPDQETS